MARRVHKEAVPEETLEEKKGATQIPYSITCYIHMLIVSAVYFVSLIDREYSSLLALFSI